MQQGQGYQLKIINTELRQGTVYYTIQVVNTNTKLSWQFEERYKVMLQMHSQLTGLINAKQIPQFPSKRMFGNTDPEFIALRKASLQNYFKTLLQFVDVDKVKPLKDFITRGEPKQVRDPKSEQQQSPPQRQFQQEQPVQVQQQLTKAKSIKTEYDKITNETNSKLIDMGFMVNAPDENDIEKKKFLYDQVKVDPRNLEAQKVQIPKNPDAVLVMANPTLEVTQTDFFQLLDQFQKEVNQILGVM